MRRGTFSLAGTTLNFSRGRVGFDGTGVAGKIDPTLDFQADSEQAGVTATLKVTGLCRCAEDRAVQRARSAAGRGAGASCCSAKA